MARRYIVTVGEGTDDASAQMAVAEKLRKAGYQAKVIDTTVKTPDPGIDALKALTEAVRELGAGFKEVRTQPVQQTAPETTKTTETLPYIDEYAEKIRDYLSDHRMTQKEFGRIIGIDSSTVSCLFRGKLTFLKRDTLAKLKSFFGEV